MKRYKAVATILFITAVLLLVAYFLCPLFVCSPISPAVRVTCLVLVCILLYCGMLATEKALERKKIKSLRRSIFLIFFALYLLLMFTFTWADEYYKRGRKDEEFIWSCEAERREEFIKTNLQTEPLKTVKKYINGYADGRVRFPTLLRNIVGNLVLLMPLALFLPLFFEKQKCFLLFFVTVAAVSALIEAVQLSLMIGVCDVDDLLLNTSGATVAYLCMKLPPIRSMIKKLAF